MLDFSKLLSSNPNYLVKNSGVHYFTFSANFRKDGNAHQVRIGCNHILLATSHIGAEDRIVSSASLMLNKGDIVVVEGMPGESCIQVQITGHRVG